MHAAAREEVNGLFSQLFGHLSLSCAQNNTNFLERWNRGGTRGVGGGRGDLFGVRQRWLERHVSPYQQPCLVGQINTGGITQLAEILTELWRRRRKWKR